MAEPARLRPDVAAPAPRRRPPLFADYLPDAPIAPADPRATRAWIVRELLRLAFLAAVIAPLVAFLWTRK